MTARRQWVLLQTLPGRIWPGNDIFSEVLEALHPADTNIMWRLICTMLRAAIRKDLFPTGPHSNPSLFLVIDEAQVTAREFKKSFHCHIRETDKHPIFHAMYRFLHDTSIF
jgi:DNA-binding FadR family transcriptional regulator